MKTILKFNVYLDIDSDDGVDRKCLVDSVNSVLYPELVNYVAKANIKSSVLEKIRKLCPTKKLRAKFITEDEILKLKGLRG